MIMKVNTITDLMFSEKNPTHCKGSLIAVHLELLFFYEHGIV